MSTINLTYGGYDFAGQAGPIPLLTINKSYQRAADGSRVGERFNITLEGTLRPSGGDGLLPIDTMQDAMLSGFSQDGQHFYLTCDGSPIISQYPRINNIRFDKSNNNWYQTCPYTIELEWDGSGISGSTYLESVEERWNVEISKENSLYGWTYSGTGDTNTVVINISHNVSAKGLAHYDGGGLTKPAWQHARDFVSTKLGWDNSFISQTGVLNLDGPDFSGFNHARLVNIDQYGGSYSVDESWVALDVTNYPNNAGNAIEDFTVTVNKAVEEGTTSVDIQGNIQGLELVQYDPSYSVTMTKWASASGYWENIKPKLFGRCRMIGEQESSREFNPLPLRNSVGHNPTRGVISYNYSYNDRPCNIISNASYERIQVQDIYPTDVFVEVVIPGRAYGPILQNINTVTSSQRTVNIDAVLNPATGCGSISGMLLAKSYAKTQAEEFLALMELEISGSNVQMFKSQDTDGFDHKTGRYTRNTTWTYNQCGGTPPDTTFN